MLEGILIILLIGFLAGELAGRVKLPKLIGMLLAGIIVGPNYLDILPDDILNISEEIRLLALLFILFKAGLGLDKNKIISQGTVAIRLAFLPAVIEASVVAVATRFIFGWEWLICFLLGWIVCAASPAVIVPLMLRLKGEGWGVKKGIPDLILAGGTASDATAITMFGIFLAWIVENGAGGGETSVALQVMDIPLQVILAIGLGIAAGFLALYLIRRSTLTSSNIHDLIVALGLGLLLIIGDDYLPFSAFLAVMVLGFVILEKDAVTARRLRVEVDKIWVVGEIFLFVLIGAAVDVGVILDAGPQGLAIIAIGLLIGRWGGIFASTWGSSLNLGERVFMVGGDMAKATVQAAIGGIPLAMGVPHGEIILAISVLAIILTAPLGAFLTVFLAPRLLEKGKVDPTKVNIQDDYVLLAAYDGSEASQNALQEAVRAARQMDAHLVVLHVQQSGRIAFSKEELKNIVAPLARDISYKIKVETGSPAKFIVEEAEKNDVNQIYMGKHNQSAYTTVLMGDTAEDVVHNSSTPVILID